MNLLGALRRYFFMEAGDWAGALTEGLCRHTAEGGDLQEHALQDALSDALRGSSCEGDVYTGEFLLVDVAALGHQLAAGCCSYSGLGSKHCVHLTGMHSNVAAHGEGGVPAAKSTPLQVRHERGLAGGHCRQHETTCGP